MTKKEPTTKNRASRVQTSTSEGERQRPAAAARRKRTPATVHSHSSTLSDEHVRVHAYYLYLQRGGRPGDPLEDWLRAEREIETVVRQGVSQPSS